MARETAISVCFEGLVVDDTLITWDRDHGVHGARGKVYWHDPDTRMVSLVTNGCADTWESCADGLQKEIA